MSFFEPFSKYPPLVQDLSFWCPEAYHCNDFYDLVRTVAGDLVERVSLVDEYRQPSTGRTSRCYRIVYRSMDRTMTRQEAADMHQRIRTEASARLGLEMRTK